MHSLKSFSREAIRRAISAEFPRIEVHSLRLLDGGLNHAIAEVNGEIILRFPRGDKARFETEIRVLECLKGRTSLAIPQVEFKGGTVACVGYRKIPGRHVTEEIVRALDEGRRSQLVCDLAAFLFEVHSAVSVEKASGLGVEREDLPSYASYVEKNVLAKVVPADIAEFARATLAEYDSVVRGGVEEVFLYNDLHGDNMAFDASTGRLNGVFDFADVMIGDVNLDFHPLFRLDPLLMKAVAEEYARLSGRLLSLRRMVIYAFVNELCDLGSFMDRPRSAACRTTTKRISKRRRDFHIFA